MEIDIKHIARLAYLKIDDNQVDKFESDMKDIIKMANNLPEINEIIEPNTNTSMPLREDKCVNGIFSREELLINAPEIHSNYFVVPKTVG
ncbi:MAG: Asp-tRNA(Asn)/Glu-tRNA(Gln) amidotransferase subunit GatC [Ruminococcus sp.]|nr:Asp-tRNA(Asn)/Glu-tRNA(Gln) amidotransferase subunit GatC [Ruminococcus sp.]